MTHKPLASGDRHKVETALLLAMQQVSGVLTRLENKTPFCSWPPELQSIFVLALCRPPRRHRAYANEAHDRKGKYRMQEEVRADWSVRKFFPRPHTSAQARAVRLLGARTDAQTWARLGLAASELRARLPYMDNLCLVLAKDELLKFTLPVSAQINESESAPSMG